MPIKKTCKQCNSAFNVKPSHSEQYFCSRNCKTEYEALHGRPAAQKQMLQFTCKECGSPFKFKPAYVRHYQSKFGKAPVYCSMPCSDKGRRKDADERHKTRCKNCGNEFYRTRRKGSGTIYHEQELCSKQCKNEWVSKVYREKHGFSITKRIRRGGYISIRIPAQNGEPARKDVFEHRYVMEQHLGRRLYPDETVHHRDGNRQHNALENLELFSSRHGPGQRVVDKVQFAIEMLRLYSDFAKQFGVELHEILPPV